MSQIKGKRQNKKRVKVYGQKKAQKWVKKKISTGCNADENVKRLTRCRDPTEFNTFNRFHIKVVSFIIIIIMISII